MRIRTRLLILVLSVLIPAILVAGLAIWYVFSEQQEAQEKSIAEAAKALASLVDTSLAAQKGVLRTLANSPALQRGDLKTFYEYAKSMAPSDDSNIVLTDVSGNQLINTRLPFGELNLPKGSPNFAELRQQYGPTKTLISDLYIGPVSKRHSYAVQVPVQQGGNIRFYLEMGAFAEQMQSLLMQQQLPEQWLGVIVDRNGYVVARTRSPDKFVGTRVTVGMYQDLMAQRDGIHWGKTLDGKPTAGFFSYAPNSEWRVIIGIPLSELRRTAIEASKIMAGIMALLLGLAIFVARELAKKTVQPIEALRVAAERLGKGEQISAVHTGIMEMDSVSTAMVKASNELRQGRTELEERIARAVASAEEAQRALLQAQKLEALGRLTGGIAHDFNNLLQTQTTALQLAHLTSNEPKVQSLIETCQKAVARSSSLVKQLMSFGRVQDATLQTIDLNERISSSRQLLEGVLPSNIRFEVQIDDNVWPVTVDPVQFDLAILNIVINARDAMPEKGHLQMSIRNQVLSTPPDNLPPGDYVLVSIRDNGKGMSPEVLSKALDPFFTTKEIGKGTGLGLPQAYGFAKQSHGTLVIHSKLGIGTTITIYLPKATNNPIALDPSEPDEVPSNGSGVILFVDDDSLVRESVPPALEKRGFNVVVARDGEEALGFIRTGQHFDAVFSDIVMPGHISGMDLAEAIRKKYPSIKVVLATGYSDKHVSIPDVQLLAKPYTVADAVQTLSRAIESSE